MKNPYVSNLRLDKIKETSNYGGGGPMSSHHRVSSYVVSKKNIEKLKEATNIVSVFGGNKFHSSYSSWNPRNDMLRTSFTNASKHNLIKNSARLNSNSSREEVVNCHNEQEFQKILKDIN